MYLRTESINTNETLLQAKSLPHRRKNLRQGLNEGILAQSHQEAEDIEVRADHLVQPIVADNGIHVYVVDDLDHRIVVPDHHHETERVAAVNDTAAIVGTGRPEKKVQFLHHHLSNSR